MDTQSLGDIVASAWANTTRYTGVVSGERSWAAGGPVAIMVHHTAPPNPYPLASLAGTNDGRLKANVAPRQDGELVILSGRACNFSSGIGARVVLDDVRRDVAPGGTAAARSLTDDTSGNPWFINFEVDHPGDGSVIPDVQLDAVVAACAAICRAQGWSANRVISHAEWTRRKVDPRWNSQGGHQTLVTIRNQVREALMVEPSPPTTGPNGEPNWDQVSPWARTAWTDAHLTGLVTRDSDPQGLVTTERLMVFLARLGII